MRTSRSVCVKLASGQYMLCSPCPPGRRFGATFLRVDAVPSRVTNNEVLRLVEGLPVLPPAFVLRYPQAEVSR